MLSARSNMFEKLRAKHPFVEDGVLLSKLVAYTSKLVLIKGNKKTKTCILIDFFKAHSCVEKAGMITMAKLRILDTDDNYSLQLNKLEAAIQDDRRNGFIPFFVIFILLKISLSYV